MATSAEDVVEITASITQLADEIGHLLNIGKDLVKESRDQFVNSKIGKMFGMSFAYERCFKRLKVQTKTELEQVIHRNIRNSELRETSMQLLEIEAEWDVFMADIDRGMEQSIRPPVCLGETGPLDFSVVDARSGETTSLREQLTAGTSLVLVLLRHFA